jgi:alpha-L-fucosidase
MDVIVASTRRRFPGRLPLRGTEISRDGIMKRLVGDELPTVNSVESRRGCGLRGNIGTGFPQLFIRRGIRVAAAAFPPSPPPLLMKISAFIPLGCALAAMPLTFAGPLPAAGDSSATALPPRVIAPGPFEPSWESLQAHFQCPEWFRDAKFGIWAHWSAQCVPEQGDWYARKMYLQGQPQYEYHVKHYGHPSRFGFMEIENLWKAERWDPERLMALYKRAGAKYFVALANHHDNFDAYDSKYHAWNSVNVGPKKDIVGTWAKVARENGLRFGVSNHSAHAWHWYQTAYGYDAEGPLAGVRYDAYTLKKEDGKGKWWEGLDPQELYTGPNIVIPDGLLSIQEQNAWHEAHDRQWDENPPANNQHFTDTWFLRCQDLVDKYKPDLMYFDNQGLPLGQAGLDMAAHYYNAGKQWHEGKNEIVLNAKGITDAHRGALVEDIERGVAEGIRDRPWQTDTCIGAWHYERSLYENDRYKTVGQVVRMLADIVSKNGNLLLSIPMRGDGTIDDKEEAFLEGMAGWMAINDEAIFATRPWSVYGEGPSVHEIAEAGHFGGAKDVRDKPYTAEDMRFTTKGDCLYAIVLEPPKVPRVVVKSLGSATASGAGFEVREVTLLGYPGKIEWTQDESGLRVQLPATIPGEHAFSLKITRAARG